MIPLKWSEFKQLIDDSGIDHVHYLSRDIHRLWASNGSIVFGCEIPIESPHAQEYISLYSINANKKATVSNGVFKDPEGHRARLLGIGSVSEGSPLYYTPDSVKYITGGEYIGKMTNESRVTFSVELSTDGGNNWFTYEHFIENWAITDGRHEIDLYKAKLDPQKMPIRVKISMDGQGECQINLKLHIKE